MKKGKVKWYNQQKGFGFITGEDGQDVFVHYTGIVAGSPTGLKENDNVTYEISSSDKGPKAINVKIV